jgi:hypothetical protein
MNHFQLYVRKWRVPVVGHAVEPACGNGGEFGERPRPAVVPEAVAPDPVPWSKVLWTRTRGDDLARQVTADDEGERDSGYPAARLATPAGFRGTAPLSQSRDGISSVARRLARRRAGGPVASGPIS